MKTITIKLPNNEVERLEQYISKKEYPSKSEFIRNLIRDKLDEEFKKKEQMGWLSLAEKSLETIWDNKEDENVWAKYL